VPWLGSIKPRALREGYLLLQVSASKNEGRGRKSILVENKEGMRKRIEGDCTKVTKESYD